MDEDCFVAFWTGISAHEIHHHVEEVFVDNLILVEKDTIGSAGFITKSFDRIIFTNDAINIAVVFGDDEDCLAVGRAGFHCIGIDPRDKLFWFWQYPIDHAICFDIFALFKPINIRGHFTSVDELKGEITSHLPFIIVARGIDVVVEVDTV